MRPTLFELPLPGGLELAVPAYGAMLTVGFLLGVVISARRAGDLGATRLEVFAFGYLAVLGGVAGAHLLYLALLLSGLLGGAAPSWKQLPSLVAVSFSGSGLAYYGGLAGGMLVLALYARWRRLPTLELFDFVAPLGALGLATTRVGCFLNGCCFGKPSGAAWAVVFPPGSPAQRAQQALGAVAPGQPSLPVHPTPLYEALAALTLFALLWRRYPRRRFAGQTTLEFLALYAAWRFGAEFLRADTPAVAGGTFTIYQYASLLLLAASAGALLVRRRRDGAEPIRS